MVWQRVGGAGCAIYCLPSVQSAPLATSLVLDDSVVDRMCLMASTRPGVSMMIWRFSSVNARFHSADSA